MSDKVEERATGALKEQERAKQCKHKVNWDKVIAASQKHQKHLEEERARLHLEQLQQEHREQERARKEQERPKVVNWGEFVGEMMTIYIENRNVELDSLVISY